MVIGVIGGTECGGMSRHLRRTIKISFWKFMPHFLSTTFIRRTHSARINLYLLQVNGHRTILIYRGSRYGSWCSATRWPTRARHNDGHFPELPFAGVPPLCKLEYKATNQKANSKRHKMFIFLITKFIHKKQWFADSERAHICIVN